jgi:hypothetical protein
LTGGAAPPTAGAPPIGAAVIGMLPQQPLVATTWVPQQAEALEPQQPQL